MNRLTIRKLQAILAIAGLLATLPALAAKVYQWKDAQGVTHYSDAPPPERKGVQNRQLKDQPAAASAGDAAREDPNCVTARKNLVELRTDKPVGLDENGDGEPDKIMSAEERTEQVQQTERMIKAFCDKA